MQAVSFHFEFSTDEAALLFVRQAARSFKLPCFRQDQKVFVIALHDQLDDLVAMAKDLDGKVIL